MMTEPETRATLDGDDLATWASFATILEWLPPALDARLHEFGLTHFEYGILFALANAPDRTLRMSVLAGFANSSLSRLSRAASRLETQTLTRRETDPSDGRFTLAILTEEGMRRYEVATPVHEGNVRALVLDALTKQQKNQLREIAGRMMRAIRSEDDSVAPVIARRG